MDQQWVNHWSPVVEVFHPFKQPGRGVPADFYVPRPDSPLDRIETLLRLNPAMPHAIVLTGHRGSGKSSELAQLANRLNDRMIVLWLDADRRFDMHRVGQTELFLGLAATVHGRFKVAKEFDELKKRLATVAEDNLDKHSAAVVLSLIKTLGAEGRISLFERETRQRIEIPPVMGGLVDGLNRMLSAAAAQVNDTPLALIVDGTDDLDLESARPIFVNNRLLADIHCHLVLTIPFALYASAAQGEARQQGFLPFLLPNVKLHDRHQAELHAAGLALMEDVVARRLAHVNAENRLEGAALRRFVEMSGGVMRELILLINKACVQATLDRSERITRQVAEAVIAEYRREKAWGLSYDYFYEELAKVHASGILTDRREKDEQGQEVVVCDRLLHTLYLLGYEDGVPWFDVHPLVWPLVDSYLKRTGRGLVTA